MWLTCCGYEGRRARLKDVHITVGVVAITLNSVAGLWGAWCWWRVVGGRAAVWFWRLMRAAQLSLVVQAALGGVLLAMGKKVPSLHIVYGLLPLGVSFLGEQLRISAAT